MTDKSDYPEHLNPFKKRTGIRGSFREFKSALKRTFTRKSEKPINVPIRLRQDTLGCRDSVATAAHRPNSEVTYRHSSGSEYNEALPRSRFNERVGKTHTIPSYTTTLHTQRNMVVSSSNPFDEEEDANSVEIKEKDLNVPGGGDGGGTMRRHRRKKSRAPLPPNHLSVQDHHDSKWSINSYDTDCSSYTYDASEVDQEALQSQHNDNQDILDMSTKIQDFCNESTDNLNAPDAQDSIKVTMPDIVVSTESDAKQDAPDNTPLDNTTLDDTTLHTTNETDSNSKNKDISEEEDKANDISSNSCNSNKDDVIVSKEQDEQECEKNVVVTSDVDVEAAKIVNVAIDDESKTELDNFVPDDQNNNNAETVSSNYNNEDTFVESKSIFISGSQDNLDNEFKESKSIYITGSCDRLAVDVDADVDLAQRNEETPIPKIRKNKLPKSAMLGITASDN